jgi:hypothetical protein
LAADSLVSTHFLPGETFKKRASPFLHLNS